MKAVPMKWNKWVPSSKMSISGARPRSNAMTFARFYHGTSGVLPRLAVGCQGHHRKGAFPFRKSRLEEIWRDRNQRTKWFTWSRATVIPRARQPTSCCTQVYSGDSSYFVNAVRELHWATYAVGFRWPELLPPGRALADGRLWRLYPHFLRAMDAVPALTAPGEDHIISSTSVIQQADYAGHLKSLSISTSNNADSAPSCFFTEPMTQTAQRK